MLIYRHRGDTNVHVNLQDKGFIVTPNPEGSIQICCEEANVDPVEREVSRMLDTKKEQR